MRSNAHFKLDQVDDVAIIRPHGDLERYQETMLLKLFQSLLNRERRKVVLDLSDVTHVHYKLLQCLREVVAVFHDLEGGLCFAAVSPYVKRIFQAVTEDLEPVMYDSLGEALLSFAEIPTPQEALH